MPTQLTHVQHWLYQNWPAPANIDAANQFLEDIKRVWTKEKKNPTVLKQTKFIEFIKAMGGNSPYLSNLILKHIDFFDFILASDPHEACIETFEYLRTYSFQDSRQAIARLLRTTKQKIALCCAIADIGNIWSLEEVTLTLSTLAETTLHIALNHLLYHASLSHKIKLKDIEDPSKESGFIILGMGKLGAKELNYSSDIDLIILYDPNQHDNHEDLGTFFVRMTKHLISLMEERDENGYVFRTDLRLRPDPSSSPLAVSLPAAISYYESMGQTWERSAMSKARPVAGDIHAGYEFLETIRPFIWRRHLDFSVIDDIHTIKKRIDHHKNFNTENSSFFFTETNAHENMNWLLGRDVKLGYGGIREIEFCAQALQLVWGGRFPELRDPATVNALKKFSLKALFPEQKATQLIHAYYFLRKIEHRLQMREDFQTHSLPQNRQDFVNFSIFLGYDTPYKLVQDLCTSLYQVHCIFKDEFSSPENEQTPILDLPLNTLKCYLKEKKIPDEAVQILQSWHHNRPRTLRTPRARSLLKKILPQLLDVFSSQKNPLLILQRFDNILEKHSASTQFLSLLERNPALIGRLAKIISISPFIAEFIANNPCAIDVLLEADILKTRINLKKTLQKYLDPVNTFSDAIPPLYTLVRSEEFRISVACIENQSTLNKASILRTSMANAVMVALLNKIAQEHQEKYGTVPGGSMCIIVLGKAGSWEMAFGSDLDLMLIYDHPETVQESEISIPNPYESHQPYKGQKILSVNQYYIRLTQKFITALTSARASGSLYEVDMRLRPSGSKGPVAVSLSSFINYHEKKAWTWERMALTRARVIGGSHCLRLRVSKAITHALSHAPNARNDRQILEDVKQMRQRLIKDSPPSSPWDVKHLNGGLMEVEFIAQALQLIAADTTAQHPCTRFAFKRLARQGYLKQADAEFLIHADEFWRNLQGLLRIFFGKNPPKNLADELTSAIFKIMKHHLCPESKKEHLSLEDLETKSLKIAQHVRKLFNHYIGHID